MNKNKKIRRRAFIRGSTNAIFCLPIAGFIFHNGKIVAAEGDVPERLFTFFFPNGSPGNSWNFSQNLAPLAPFQAKSLAITNLNNPAANNTPLPEGHGSGAATAFTGVRAPAGNAKYQSGGPTLEHYAATKLASQTLVPHMAIGMTSASAHHTGMFGLHCYVRSWKNTTTSVAPMKNPVDIFNTIFGPTWQNLVADDAKRKRHDHSVLDTLTTQYSELMGERYGLGAKGKELLRNHLDSLRELELQVHSTESELKEMCKTKLALPQNFANTVPYTSWDTVFKLQLDLLAHAINCDITRFGSIAFGESAEYYHQTFLGKESGHSASHNKDSVVFNNHIRHYMNLFSYFFQKLDSITESNNRTMLDNSVSYIATELGDQSVTGHKVDPTVAMIIGGRGRIQTGRIIDGGGRNINDALLTALKASGLNEAFFGERDLCQGALG